MTSPSFSIVSATRRRSAATSPLSRSGWVRLRALKYRACVVVHGADGLAASGGSGAVVRERTQLTGVARSGTASATIHGHRASAAHQVGRARIHRQRARGGSLRAIAESLNRDAVPTAQGGVQWHTSTVRGILARSA
jgi:Recombinase